MLRIRDAYSTMRHIPGVKQAGAIAYRHVLPRANGSRLGLCSLNCGHGRLGRSGSVTGSH